MSARVCSPPTLLDRVTPNVSTPEDLGDCPTLPTPRLNHPAEPEMDFFGRRFGAETTSQTTEATLSRRRTVSRNLFGSPTPASIQYAREKLKEIVRKESERWNFDFEAEKPLPGRYRWEPVEGGANPPAPLPPPPPSPQASASNFTPPKASLSTPTPPKQRRLEIASQSPTESLLIVTSAAGGVRAGETTPPPSPELKRKATTPPAPKSQSLLFPPSNLSVGGGSPSGQLNNPNPIPPTPSVLVKATPVDPLDENPKARKYLTTDSSRRATHKQMKITMYSAVKKRRIGQPTATAGAEKKAAF